MEKGWSEISRECNKQSSSVLARATKAAQRYYSERPSAESVNSSEGSAQRAGRRETRMARTEAQQTNLLEALRVSTARPQLGVGHHRLSRESSTKDFWRKYCGRAGARPRRKRGSARRKGSFACSIHWHRPSAGRDGRSAHAA